MTSDTVWPSTSATAPSCSASSESRRSKTLFISVLLAPLGTGTVPSDNSSPAHIHISRYQDNRSVKGRHEPPDQLEQVSAVRPVAVSGVRPRTAWPGTNRRRVRPQNPAQAGIHRTGGG